MEMDITMAQTHYDHRIITHATQARKSIMACLLFELTDGRVSTTFYAPNMISGGRFVDGALLANNPSMIALCEAKTLWTSVHVEVMVATTADSASSVFT